MTRIPAPGEKLTHELLPNGHTFRYEGRKYHVMFWFRDEHTDNILYVMKYYGKHKQWWHYEVWDAFLYDLRIRKIY